MSQKRTVLIIDDDVDIQQLLKIALKSRGYRVETANNGLEGLEKLKGITPHLIILDLNMPKMGGIAFYQNICDEYNKPRYPIFIITARANISKLFQDFIIDGFKTKPFEIDELLDEIDAVINKKYGRIGRQITVAGIERPAKVCIVENEEEDLNEIRGLFVKAGYEVHSVSNGFEAMEYVFKNLPDVVLVKLSILDITGDELILQLKSKNRTKHVKSVLYVNKNTETTIIVDKISKKYGVDRFVYYQYAHQLLTATDDLLKSLF